MERTKYSKIKNREIDGLAKDAKLHGRSLNAQVIFMLQSDLDNHVRTQRMRESAEELERLVATMPPMEDSTPLIREDRERDT